MAVQLAGNGGIIAEVSGSGFRALRTEGRPIEHGSLGAYRKSLLSGTMAAGLAANAEVFQFRWTDATRLCAVRRVAIAGLAGSSTAFTAGFAKMDLVMARAWTVAGSGGNGGTTTGNIGKLRTSMGTSLMASDMRISSTAILTLGTKTLDTDPIGLISWQCGVVVSVTYLGQVELLADGSDIGHPIILGQNEGFVLRATVPATGTWQFGVTVEWAEVASY